MSDAVSRKLSTTLGWRTVSIGEVVTQAKSLCGQHIRAWLKRRGLFTRKLGLQRLRSLASLPGGLAVSMPLMREGVSPLKAFWYGQLSGIVEPIGGVLGADACAGFKTDATATHCLQR